MAKKTQVKSPAEQQETLNKEINPTGAGEHPAIQALVSDDFTKMGDLDALAVAKAIATIVRGELREELDGTMHQLTEKIVEMEKTAKSWEEDRMKFAEEMYNLAEKTRANTPDKLKTAAESARLMQEMNEKVRIESAAKRLEIDQRVANAPRVKFAHPGIPITIREGDSKRTIMRPLEINYEHLRYVIPTDQTIEIPDFIYEHYVKEQELAKKRNKLNDVLKDGRHDVREAIAIEPAIDPTYSQQINKSLASKGVTLPQPVEGV